MIKVDPINADPIELPGSVPCVTASTDDIEIRPIPPMATIPLTKSTSLPNVSEDIPALRTAPISEDDSRPSPTTPPAGFPRLAKRYRARPVHIPSPRQRRPRSQSTTLPYIPQTSSFVSEFANIFSNHVDGLFHTRTSVLLETQTSSQDPAYPSGVGHPLGGEDTAEQASIAFFSAEPSTSTPPLVRQPFLGPRECSHSGPPPIITPKLHREKVPGPAGKDAEIGGAMRVVQPVPRHTPEEKTGADTSSSKSVSSASGESPGMTSTYDGPSQESKTEKHGVSSITSHAVFAPSTNIEKAVEQRPPGSDARPPELQPTSSASSSQTIQSQKPPLSSQTKRRRVQQRRMQAAYGREED